MTGRMIGAATAALLAAVAAAAIYLLVADPGTGRAPGAINIEGAEIGAPFTLTATDGSRVTDAEVIDRPALVYFGYTWCPDICPIDTANMAIATDILEERGIDVRPVFISVDPERDTPEALAEYVAAIHPKMIGLTGSAEELKALIAAYGGYFQRVEMPDSAMGYAMQHTGFVYLMLPGNRPAALFRQGTAPENIAAEVARVLD